MSTEYTDDELFMALFNLEKLGLINITNGDDDMYVELSDEAKKAFDGLWKGDIE